MTVIVSTSPPPAAAFTAPHRTHTCDRNNAHHMPTDSQMTADAAAAPANQRTRRGLGAGWGVLLEALHPVHASQHPPSAWSESARSLFWSFSCAALALTCASSIDNTSRTSSSRVAYQAKAQAVAKLARLHETLRNVHCGMCAAGGSASSSPFLAGHVQLRASSS